MPSCGTRLAGCAMGAMAMAMAMAIAPKWAQAQANLLPEGSADIAVSAVLGSAPSAPGSAARSTFLLPQFSAQWSNGMFLDGLALGMQLSNLPLLKFGPLIALDVGAQRTDGSHGGVRPVFGAFVNYQPLNELALHMHVVAPASRDGGVLANLRAETTIARAPHQAWTVGAGLNLADGVYMQSTFGTARYRPSGGVRDVFADARWQWQFSRKFTLAATLRLNRLQGGAADGPRTQQRTGVTSLLALGYSY